MSRTLGHLGEWRATLTADTVNRNDDPNWIGVPDFQNVVHRVVGAEVDILTTGEVWKRPRK